jgi:hypothetical protein
MKTDFREIGRSGTNWTNLTPNRDQWRALVNMRAKEISSSLIFWEILK